jgi:hypothetical protein
MSSDRPYSASAPMAVKLTKTERTFTRTLTDRAGKSVVVRVIIDDGPALDRVIARLANRVRSSKTRRLATAADGMVRVYIERDESEAP